MLVQGITVVTRPTRMQGLLQRWSTRGQAQFLFKRNRVVEYAKRNQAAQAADQRAARAAIEEVEQDALEDFAELESEDTNYQRVLETLRRDLDFGLPVQFIDRTYLPTYNFDNSFLIVVVGQDGLVANTAKYVGDLPIVAINPDPARIDGVLLPFQVKDARTAVQQTLDGKAKTRSVTLAKASLHDGQKLLAFNDLFIGARSHVSARYQLTAGRTIEQQSSSGILISTGAGSTGWLSSIVNMANGLGAFLDPKLKPHWQMPLRWEDRQLVWIVREPFVSKSSQAKLVAGKLQPGHELIIESQMPEGGVIFSDGVEQDFLTFTSGSIATITIAERAAKLVVKPDSPQHTLESTTSTQHPQQFRSIAQAKLGPTYQTLTVTPAASKVVAKIASSHVVDRAVIDMVRDDLQELLEAAPKVGLKAIEVDMHEVKFVGGNFWNVIVLFHKTCGELGITFSLKVNSPMMEIVRLTRLDKLFTIKEARSN